jgi:hypothetical protein
MMFTNPEPLRATVTLHYKGRDNISLECETYDLTLSTETIDTSYLYSDGWTHRTPVGKKISFTGYSPWTTEKKALERQQQQRVLLVVPRKQQERGGIL